MKNQDLFSLKKKKKKKESCQLQNVVSYRFFEPLRVNDSASWFEITAE